MLNDLVAIVADHHDDRRRRIVEYLRDRHVRTIEAHAWDELQDKARKHQTKRPERDVDLIFLADELPGLSGLVDRITILLGAFCREGQVVAVVEEALSEPREKRALTAVIRPSEELSGDARGVIDRCLPKMLPLPSVKIEDEKDLVLRHQVCSLDRHGQYDRGIHVLEQIIGDLREDCRSATIARLAQGYSGAMVFRVQLKRSDGKSENLVVKLSRAEDLWKAKAGVVNWAQIDFDLNRRELSHHAPDIVKPHQPDDQSDCLVRRGQHVAEAWLFLGDALGEFMDFEQTYLLHPKRPKRLRSLDPPFFSGDEGVAEAFLRRAIKTLRNCWYEKATRRDTPLWDFSDLPYPRAVSYPPYGFTGWWKANILGSLESLDSLGRKLLKQWGRDRKLIEKWFSTQDTAWMRERKRVLGHVHGDLNRHNLLLWVEHGRPFFIDFATYQQDGHVLQDFAVLETEIKFALMDREHDSGLGAFDWTPERLPMWVQAEKRFGFEKWHSGLKLNFRDNSWQNIGRAYALAQEIRVCAAEVHQQADRFRGFEARFLNEYAAALLCHTLRNIAFTNLSPFKRLLAAFSSARLIEFAT